MTSAPHLGVPERQSHAAPQVLIIAAMPFQGALLQRLLADLGCEATLTVDKEAGLVQLVHDSYDLVLIDVDLGEHVVQELAIRLRREHFGCRVAIMVGWWDERTPEMRACCDVLVYKPVHPVQVREALRTLAG